MFNYLTGSRSRAFQPGVSLEEARTLPLSPQTHAQKRHFAVFAHRTDLFIDKRLQ